MLAYATGCMLAFVPPTTIVPQTFSAHRTTAAKMGFWEKWNAAADKELARPRDAYASALSLAQGIVDSATAEMNAATLAITTEKENLSRAEAEAKKVDAELDAVKKNIAGLQKEAKDEAKKIDESKEAEEKLPAAVAELAKLKEEASEDAKKGLEEAEKAVADLKAKSLSAEDVADAEATIARKETAAEAATEQQETAQVLAKDKAASVVNVKKALTKAEQELAAATAAVAVAKQDPLIVRELAAKNLAGVVVPTASTTSAPAMEAKEALTK
jgi:chromosome segregation ATPase